MCQISFDAIVVIASLFILSSCGRQWHNWSHYCIRHTRVGSSSSVFLFYNPRACIIACKLTIAWLPGSPWAISELFFYTWDYWISVVTVSGVPEQCPLSWHAGAVSRASVSSSVSMVTAAVSTLSVKEIRLWLQTEYLQQSAAHWRHVLFAGRAEGVCVHRSVMGCKHKRYITNKCASHWGSRAAGWKSRDDSCAKIWCCL